MSIHDISLEIRENMISWGNDPVSKPKIEEGDRSDSTGSVTSEICLESHIGTHIDAPKHFIPEGDSVDMISPNKLIGECRIVDCTGREEEVKEEDVDDFAEDILIFKTRNSDLLSKNKFEEDYIYVSEDACKKIVNCGYQAVGIDYLGIGKYENTKPAHEILLSNGIIVIEGLDLRDISPGKYRFIGLPLKIRNCDGSPIRAVLEDMD